MEYIRGQSAAESQTFTVIEIDEEEATAEFKRSNSFLTRREEGIDLAKILQGSIKMPKDTTKILVRQDTDPDTDQVDDDSWEYPGWGIITRKIVNAQFLPEIHHKQRLTPFQSTSIAGNDLLGSVLYTTGIVCAACGQLGPIAMLLAVIALLPFRSIFKENGLALPLNGGVYVNMLNATSKIAATFAVSCSLISYSATAVVSAASCTSYAQGAFGDFPLQVVSVAVLALFAGLVLLGIKDSANVAAAIFGVHLITLVVLMVACVVEIGRNGGAMFAQNWSNPLPNAGSDGYVALDLWLGFSVSLLGLTGFETAINYVEEAGPFDRPDHTTVAGGEQFMEQQQASTAPPPLPRAVSVFEKTMNNMYWLVLTVNPTMVLLAVGTTDLATIVANPNNILSVIGKRVGGQWLSLMVSIDAVLVLSGGVLTAYVGVAGLIKQLAHDRCLPRFLTSTNETFQTNHWIILSFFLLCTTLYLATSGDVTILSGVFSLAFLMVLLSFALANMILKVNRPRLPRPLEASWPVVLTGFTVMLVGFVGVVFYSPTAMGFFLIYLVFYFLVIAITFQRVAIGKALLYVCQRIPWLDRNFSFRLITAIRAMKQFSVVFFSDTSEIHILNEAALYARDNENCDHMIICHVVDSSRSSRERENNNIPKRLSENLTLLDHMYPKMKIDLLIVEAEKGFTPQLVRYISNEIDIPTSFMFIRCPGKKFPFNIGEFDGVRTIMA